jgi:hypothetical protein
MAAQRRSRVARPNRQFGEVGSPVCTSKDRAVAALEGYTETMSRIESLCGGAAVFRTRVTPSETATSTADSRNSAAETMSEKRKILRSPRDFRSASALRRPRCGAVFWPFRDEVSQPVTRWRRGWDSNPRYGITVNRISNPAHSTTLPPLRIYSHTRIVRSLPAHMLVSSLRLTHRAARSGPACAVQVRSRRTCRPLRHLSVLLAR